MSWRSFKKRGRAAKSRTESHEKDLFDFAQQVAALYLSVMLMDLMDDQLRKTLNGPIPEIAETFVSACAALSYVLSVYRLVVLELDARAGRPGRWHWGWAIVPFAPATALWIATYLDPSDTPFRAGLKVLLFVGVSGFFFWLLYFSPLYRRFAAMKADEEGDHERQCVGKEESNSQ